MLGAGFRARAAAAPYRGRVRRIVGLDTARGVAILGMLTAHVGPDDGWRTVPPGGWSQLADGRPSALFVLLAGVGLALLSGGDDPVRGTRLVQARLRILVRAALLVVLGALLVRLGTPVVVILAVYGGLFAAGTLVLRWPRRALLAVAAVFALLGPVVRLLLAGVAVTDAEPLDPVAVLLNDYYPAVVWMAYVLVGVAVGRSDLRAGRTHLLLTGSGAALVLLGHGGAWAVRPLGLPPALVTAEPHSSTTFEVLGNTGTALLVVAACLAAGVRRPRALAPVTATGALALTAYCGHLVVLALLGTDLVYAPRLSTWAAFCVVAVAACWAWHTLVGRGPLEALLHTVSTRAADTTPDPLPPRTLRTPSADPVIGDAPEPAGATDDRVGEGPGHHPVTPRP